MIHCKVTWLNSCHSLSEKVQDRLSRIPGSRNRNLRNTPGKAFARRSGRRQIATGIAGGIFVQANASAGFIDALILNLHISNSAPLYRRRDGVIVCVPQIPRTVRIRDGSGGGRPAYSLKTAKNAPAASSRTPFNWQAGSNRQKWFRSLSAVNDSVAFLAQPHDVTQPDCFRRASEREAAADPRCVGE